MIRGILAAALTLVAVPAFAEATVVLDIDLPQINVGNPGDATYAYTIDNGGGTGGRATVSTGTRVSAPFAFDRWLQSDVGGNAIVGITRDYARSGNGSAYFASLEGGSKADLVYYLSQSAALTGFGGAGYDWYRQGGSDVAAGLAPALRLLLSNNGQFSSLVFEPTYQGTTVTPDIWTTSELNFQSQLWNPNGRLANPNGTYTNTLFQWTLANPNARIIGFSTGVGSGWNGYFQGGVDNIAYRFGESAGAAFNFEASIAGAVPEPGQWALMIGGFALLGTAARRRRPAFA